MIRKENFIDQYDELLNNTGSVYEATVESVLDSDTYFGGSELALMLQKCEKTKKGTPEEADLKIEIAEKLLSNMTDELARMAQEILE